MLFRSEGNGENGESEQMLRSALWWGECPREPVAHETHEMTRKGIPAFVCSVCLVGHPGDSVRQSGVGRVCICFNGKTPGLRHRGFGQSALNMLCERCHEREATVHLTKIMGPEMTKRNLCKPCVAESMPELANDLPGWHWLDPTATDTSKTPGSD